MSSEGINLPDLVGTLGLEQGCPCRASRRRRLQVGLRQPALEGTLAGQRTRGLLGQGYANTSGSPTGMFPPQVDGQVNQRLLAVGAATAAAMPGRLELLRGCAGGQAVQQVAHRGQR